MAAYLDIRGATRRFGANTVLDGVDLAVQRGEFVSLLGPSGCGKTTLLRIIAGLLHADAGSVSIDGRDLTRLPAHRRSIGVVFQNYALFPHLSVADNVGFGLKCRRMPRGEIAERVKAALERVRMGSMADRAISQLSGGQQQRVAVARALAPEPSLVLLDEPLSALDRKLRETMQVELRQLLRQLRITAVFVTHDQEEALAMSDRVAVMSRGVVEQIDTPDAVYRRPATPFVLDFVGKSNRISGRVVAGAGGMLDVDTALGRMRAPGNFLAGYPVLLAIRPERVRIGDPPADLPANTAEMGVVDRVFSGSRATLHLAHADGAAFAVELDGTAPTADRMRVWWPASETLSFPAP